jgi:hypothetical protein
MKPLLLSLAIIGCTALVMPVQAQKKLKQMVTLQVPEGDGSNSAAVAWNPVTKKYYTSMAGNAIYPMGVYDIKGKLVQENLDADNDYRGIWYNPVSKRIEFNCYDSGGIGHFNLDAKGQVNSKVIDFEGMNQPDNQCVGVYYPPGNNIIYFSSTYIVTKYSAKTGSPVGEMVILHPGCKTKADLKKLEEDADALQLAWDDRNASSVQYTGIPKSELALLNITNHTIEFYDQKTGLMTTEAYSIPDTIPLYTSFNFSYTNGMWWFFNKDERKWIGCK